jgi:hypothetical protein
MPQGEFKVGREVEDMSIEQDWHCLLGIAPDVGKGLEKWLILKKCLL